MDFHGWFGTFWRLSSEWNPVIISFKNFPNGYCSAFTQWLARHGARRHSIVTALKNDDMVCDVDMVGVIGLGLIIFEC